MVSNRTKFPYIGFSTVMYEETHGIQYVMSFILNWQNYYNFVVVLQLQLVLQATLWLMALLQILHLSCGVLHPLTNKMDSFVTTSFIALQLEVAPWSTRLQTLLK